MDSPYDNSEFYSKDSINLSDYNTVAKEGYDPADIVKEQKERKTNDTDSNSSNIMGQQEPSKENSISNPLIQDGSTIYNDIVNVINEDNIRQTLLQIKDPFYMLCFFDPDINDGIVTLYPWQRDVLLDLAQCRNKKEVNNLIEYIAGPKATAQNAYKYCLLASNGSGKDKFIIAPWTVFFLLTKLRSRVIITTSSGTQLTGQTEPYIKDLCEKINKYFGADIFTIRQRYIRCNLTGSECRMFATDEAGKAEGYHPIDAHSEMCIIVNEGKSVTEDIHKALRRCTGYNYWIECSSAGAPKGYLHFAYNKFPNTKRVTTYDCPHQSTQDLEEDKISDGESSAYFRSKHLSLFTSIDGQVVIPIELVEQCLKNPPAFDYKDWPMRIGIDLAAGGDENAICVTKGNKIIKEVSFREKDTTITASRINAILKSLELSKEHKYIYADDGGVGHSIIDMLNKPSEEKGYGWNINRIMNQWAALGDKKRFGNRGAENWYRIARIIEDKYIDLRGLGTRTLEQIYNRLYRQSTNNGKIYLQDKKEAKAQGFASPDRADAFILAFTGLTVHDFIEDTPKKESFILQRRHGEQFKTSQEVYEHYEHNVTFKEFNDFERENNKTNSKRGKRIYNSLREAIINS